MVVSVDDIGNYVCRKGNFHEKKEDKWYYMDSDGCMKANIDGVFRTNGNLGTKKSGIENGKSGIGLFYLSCWLYSSIKANGL